MFRLTWLVFHGPSRMDHEVEHHVHESPVTMTGVLVVLAVLSAVGGFISIPHFLETQLPLPAIQPALKSYQMTVVVLSIVLGLAGLAGAWFFYGGPLGRTTRIKARLGGVYRMLYGKYFIDEAYEFFLGRPLHWISEHVFLRFGDRAVIDGTLHGLAGLARGSGGLLARVQTGNLQLYALLVLVGSFVCLVWSWANG
jgi:NADH-quinone oxidoreductase subunit L